MVLRRAGESFNPKVTAVILAPRWKKSDSYRLCDKERTCLINNNPQIFSVTRHFSIYLQRIVLDNLNVALALSAIHLLYFSSTLKKGNNPVRLCFSQYKSHQKNGKTALVTLAE